MRSQLLALLGLFAASAIASGSQRHARLKQLHKDGRGTSKLLDLHKDKQVPNVMARADSKPEPKPESKPGPKPESKPGPKPEPKPGSKPGPKPESKPGPKPGPKPASGSGTSPLPHTFLNEKTKRFSVDGKNIPEVKGDVGESYAGRLPISAKKGELNEFFFWFFPSDYEEHRKKKEITIWLNGGPGCSSLLGLLKENGPFIWPTGTLKPILNPWSFHHLTNMVWIDQPVSVGFSTGKSTIHNEDELAEQFMGFWKNFVETFSMQGYKVFIATESYGGYYGPFIGSHFVNAKDPRYFDLGGLMVIDGASFNDEIQTEAVSAAYVEQNSVLFGFNHEQMEAMRDISKACGYEEYLHKYYTYPPSGPQPQLVPWAHNVFPNGTLNYTNNCGALWTNLNEAASDINPCFNPYNIRDYCPNRFDPILDSPYFDREDVKRAIHAPLDVKWTMCVDTAFVGKVDKSKPPFRHELPNVIDKTQNVIYALGGMDFILPASGILLGIQNMTWGGKMGFQTRPTKAFYVPLYRDPSAPPNSDFYGSEAPSLAGIVGTTHTERGFTIAATALSGHEGPQYVPTASFRQLEKLLGRVHSLSDIEPFTLPQLAKFPQVALPLGSGSYPIPCLPGKCSI